MTARGRLCFLVGVWGYNRSTMQRTLPFAGRCAPRLLREDDIQAHVGRGSHLADFSQPLRAVAAAQCDQITHVSHMCKVRRDMRVRAVQLKCFRKESESRSYEMQSQRGIPVS